MERAVQIFAVINFVIIGLSHTFQPHAWVDFFVLLRERGHAGVFAAAFISIWFGSIVVAFHNVWSGIPIVLTLIGWGQVVKLSFISSSQSLAFASCRDRPMSGPNSSSTLVSSSLCWLDCWGITS